VSTLPGFRKRLTDLAEPKGAKVTTWSPGGQTSRNLIQLSTASKAMVLYVKEFNTVGRPGFWGLTRNQVTRLEQADTDWFAVLLLRSSIEGYVLARSEVRGHIADGSFELSGDGDYKVNEHVDLKSQQRFRSLSELLGHLL